MGSCQDSGVDKRLGKSGDVLLENAGTSTRHAKRIRFFVSNAGSRRRCHNPRIRKHGQWLKKQEQKTAPRVFLSKTAGKPVQRGAFQVWYTPRSGNRIDNRNKTAAGEKIVPFAEISRAWPEFSRIISTKEGWKNRLCNRNNEPRDIVK